MQLRGTLEVLPAWQAEIKQEPFTGKLRGEVRDCNPCPHSQPCPQ